MELIYLLLIVLELFYKVVMGAINFAKLGRQVER
jgi:hypothetical protein